MAFSGSEGARPRHLHHWTTGATGTEKVEGRVGQVVKGGENWVLILRVDRENAQSAAILLTEPRISALRSLEPDESVLESSTIEGGYPEGQNLDTRRS